MSADKAYLSSDNLQTVVGHNAMPYIAFKVNSTGNSRSNVQTELWKNMFHFFSFNQALFMQSYHKRSNVETTFHMIKTKFGDRLRSKTRTAQINESCAPLSSRSEAPTGSGRINLKRAGEDHIGQRQARTPEALRNFFDAFAQLRQQREKAFLLVSLRSIVGRPFLLVGLLDRNCLSESLSLGLLVESKFALGHNLNRIKVLASELSRGEVWTGAMRLSGVGLDDIGVVTTFGLRRDKPSVAIVAALKFRFGGNH